MRLKRLVAVVAVAVLGGSRLAPGVGPEPFFGLKLDAPSSVVAAARSSASYNAIGRLATSGLTGADPGAQGWSISLAAEGGSIVGITLAGTAADDIANGGLYDEGFQRSELTGGAGNEGAVSAVVLSLQNPVTLPPAGEATIVKLTLHATVPDPVLDDAGDPSCEPLVSRVFYVDGLKGVGQPVDNKVTWQGTTFRPTTGDATTSICPIFVNPVLFRVDVESGSAGDRSGDRTAWKLGVPEGSGFVPVKVNVVLVSNLPGTGGVQGWSVSVPTDDCFGIHAVTTQGTAVDRYYSDGFKKTELVDPSRNGGRHGVASAVVLSFQDPRMLPEVGEEIVLKIAGSMDASGISGPGDLTDACSVRIARTEAEYLRGSGQPVKTGATVQGGTRTPGVCGAAIRLTGIREGVFVRGDANNDTKDNLADAVWIVNELFRSGSRTLCRDAADANNDGQIDLSDALYIVGYQFQGESPPPAPFPDCGTDPEGDSDGLTCAETQVRCRGPGR